MQLFKAHNKTNLFFLSNSEMPEDRVRLSGGENHTGRVEIWKHGEWGTICDNNWDLEDANVVCRQLGYPGALQALEDAAFGPGRGRIWLSNLQCNGSEKKLMQCVQKPYKHCSHSQDAAVICKSRCLLSNSKQLRRACMHWEKVVNQNACKSTTIGSLSI